MGFPRTSLREHLTRPGGLAGEISYLRSQVADAIDSLFANKVTNPGTPITTGTVTARSLTALGLLRFQPSAEVVIDVPGSGSSAWDTTTSSVLEVHKNVRTYFGIKLDVTTNGGGLWTTPAGLNQDYILPFSYDGLNVGWRIYIDGPNKIIRVMPLVKGALEPTIAAPTTGAGDTYDLSVAGATGYSGNAGVSAYFTGAPRSDGAAFMADRVNNTVTIEDRGDGNGPMILFEVAATNQVLQNETLFSNVGVITSPWVAMGSATGLGVLGGSPKGDATVCSITMTASASDGVKQSLTGVATQTNGSASVWARCASGTQKFRLQVLAKDGRIYTSADLNLTTTWARYDLFVLDTGAVNTSGAFEFRIINASDAAARTIQVWRPQFETGRSFPTSPIKTIAATAARTGETFSITNANPFPASFGARGYSIQMAPDFSVDEFATSGVGGSAVVGWTIVSWQTSLYNATGAFNASLSSLQVVLGLGTAERAGLSMYIQQNYRAFSSSGESIGAPNHRSPLFAWSRGTLLTFDEEAYRGALRVRGYTAGPSISRFPLSGGPWSRAASANAFVGGNGFTGTNTTFSGRIGKIMTSV